MAKYTKSGTSMRGSMRKSSTKSAVKKSFGGGDVRQVKSSKGAKMGSRSGMKKRGNPGYLYK